MSFFLEQTDAFNGKGVHGSQYGVCADAFCRNGGSSRLDSSSSCGGSRLKCVPWALQQS